MKWYYGKRPSIFVVDLTVSKEDVHLGTSVWGGYRHSPPLNIIYKGYSKTEGWVNRDKGWGWRITNISGSCYLHIKCFPTNSLASLMWRWCLNSKQATLQLIVEGSRRCEIGQKNSPQLTHTWMVKTVQKP